MKKHLPIVPAESLVDLGFSYDGNRQFVDPLLTFPLPIKNLEGAIVGRYISEDQGIIDNDDLRAAISNGELLVRQPHSTGIRFASQFGPSVAYRLTHMVVVPKDSPLLSYPSVVF